MRYSGHEKLWLNGHQTKYSVLQFWQVSLSELLFNMNRGAFAEYIVRAALDSGGFDSMSEEKIGVESYDITGPVIPASGKPSRIEVKSAASIQHTTPVEKEPISLPDTQLKFSIRKAIDWWGDDEIPRRNNDIYVFCHYTATRKRDNILDLSFWEFYVLPTFRINESSLDKQTSISVWRLKHIGLQPCNFEDLYSKIINALAEIPAQ